MKAGIVMRKILVVIDMQNDFINGSLGTVEAVNIIPPVIEKIKSYRENNYDIVFTKDTHEADYLNTAEGKKLPVQHCIKNTSGWELNPEVSHVVESSKVFDKPSFGSVELAEYLKKENYEEIELIGLCTDICVISNALLIKAYLPESSIRVDSNCCAGVTNESHNNALEAMKMCQIDII